MNTFPNLSLAGMNVPRQLLAAARFLPAACEAIKARKLSVPASFFVAGSGEQTIGISTGDVVLTAPSADLDRIKDIVIALEDRRFHRHGGIDVRGIFRASIANARALRAVQGGSTLTQQLVRNTLLNPDRTAVRKVCEMVLALVLERHYSKSEILDLYCHHVFLGAGTRGFPAAAKLLYRRPIGALDDGRLVALAGLLRAPSRTHPSTNSEAFVSRAKALQKRLGAGSGSGEVAPANPADSRRLPRSRHTHQIRAELQRFGVQDGDVARVTTSVQPRLQAGLNDALATAFENPKVRACAAVVLDVHSSEVVAESAWANGKESDFSVALRGAVQPGSTFKPFAALAALEQGFTINQKLESAPFESAELGSRRDKPWRVRNYAHVYRGQVTLLDALRTSDNTAFARLTEMLDRASLARTFQRFRLCDPRDVTPAIVLGAHRAGVRLAALANAYAAIARGGVYLPYRLVRFIEFRDGTIFAAPKPPDEIVVRDYSVVTALRDALADIGTRFSGVVFAGKTGTTALGSLFAAYDDRLSYAVWLGFRDPIPEGDPKALSAIGVFERLVRRALGAPSGVLSIM